MREGLSDLAVTKWIVRLALLVLGVLLPVAAFADADEAPAVGSGPAPGDASAQWADPRGDAISGRIAPHRAARRHVCCGANREAERRRRSTSSPARRRGCSSPGLTVMAKTYNGVVPGPVLAINQGDHVVIDYRNELAIPDTIHLHGIHGARRRDMDGVPGSSQALVPPHGSYRYVFTATQPGTFIYHTHDSKAVFERGPLRRDRRHPDASPGRGARPRTRLPRDHFLVVHQQQRRERVHAQRQGVSRDRRPRRAARRAHPHPLDQHLGRELAHDAHAWPLHAHHRARRDARVGRRTSKTRSNSGQANAPTSRCSPTNSRAPGSSTATCSTTSKTAAACPTG